MHVCMQTKNMTVLHTVEYAPPYPGRTVYMVQLKPAGERKYFISLSFFHFIFLNYYL